MGQIIILETGACKVSVSQVSPAFPQGLSVSALLVCSRDCLLSLSTWGGRKEEKNSFSFASLILWFIFSHFPSIVEKVYALISYSSSSLSGRDLWFCPYSAMTAFGLGPGKDPRGHSSRQAMEEKGNEAYVCFWYQFPIKSLKTFPHEPFAPF